jgi:hypothetical protein
MPESLLGVFGGTVHSSWRDAVLALASAYVVGQILAWTYEATYHGLSYSRKFADSLTLLTCVSSAFVLLAKQSLLAGLGLVAVVSLVRFRANVKAPHDLVFVMCAATFGLGAGLVALEVTFIALAAFCLFALFLSHDSLGSRRRFDGVLRVRSEAAQDDAKEFEAILARHCERSVLLSSSELGQAGLIERSYQVKFRGDDSRHGLIADLSKTSRVRDARLLLQELNLEY